jgi:hypothetical protein
VFITADFIYWKPQSDGLDYAYSGNVPGGGFTSEINAQEGKLQAPSFTYVPGFKAGLGVLTNHDNWDVYAEYTWLRVTEGDTTNALHGSTASPVHGTNQWGYLGISPVYGDVAGSWYCNFNALDVELGRNFWISKRLALRPHAGLKFSWIQQHYHIKGSNLIVSGSQTDHLFTQDFSLKQFGVGIRTGLDTAYHLWNKWAIFADFALTGLWNSFDTSRKDLYQAAPGESVYTNADVHQDPHAVTAVAEMDLGVRFETVFGKGQYKYMLQAGWETQVWFAQERFIRFTMHTPSNVTFEGLTIKTGFWF